MARTSRCGATTFTATGCSDIPTTCKRPILVYIANLDFYGRIMDVISNRVYLRASHAAHFVLSDHIEIDWDGIVRTVTEIGTDATHGYIEFTPGAPRIQYKSQVIGNWKIKANYTLDLTPAAGSPATGNGSSGGNIGSKINTV